MCLEYYPECGDGGDGCCGRRLNIALAYAKRDSKRNRPAVPRIYCRRVDFQLYACWAVKDGTRISEFVDACCPVCAKAEFIAQHFFDKALDELNRMYSLIDDRTENIDKEVVDELARYRKQVGRELTQKEVEEIHESPQMHGWIRWCKSTYEHNKKRLVAEGWVQFEYKPGCWQWVRKN
jgi:hypothetical protein